MNIDVLNSMITVSLKLGPSWRNDYQRHFESISDNYAKVDYVYDLLIKHQAIPKFCNPLEFKTNEMAEYLRKKGNDIYQNNGVKRHLDVIKLYNQSICFAKEGSESLALGYSNRSVIAFKWECYKECLENIRLARKSNCPARIKKVLDIREKKCLELSQKDRTAALQFQLKYGAHNKIPFISNCLDIGHSEEEGRFIYTKKALRPGDLVIKEEPFVTSLFPEKTHLRCANCSLENCLTLIPCPSCTGTMFCNEDCLTKGTEAFHKYECPVHNILFSSFGRFDIQGLRICLVALTSFETVDECKSFCEQACNQGKSAFDLNYENYSKKELYRAIHGLVTNQAKRPTADLFGIAIKAAVMRNILMEKTPLKNILDSDEKLNFFTGLLLQHMQSARHNTFNVFATEKASETAIRTHSNGLYAIASLLNHSCAPNVFASYKGTEINFMVLRPISAGDTLYCNYGVHFGHMDRPERQLRLKEQQLFYCNCEACACNYNTRDAFLKKSKSFANFLKHNIEIFAKLNVTYCKNNWENSASYLYKYASNYPSLEITNAEESLKVAIQLLIEELPLSEVILHGKQ